MVTIMVKFIVSILYRYTRYVDLITSMKVTVAVIEDAFLDLQRLNHAGVVICYKEKGSGTPIMMIPGNGAPTAFFDFSGGDDRNPLQENYEGYYRINVRGDNCQFFDVIAEGILGMIFNGAEDPKLLTLFISSKMHFEKDGPQVALLKFVSELGSKKKPFVADNFNDLKKFIYSNGPKWLGKIFEEQCSLNAKGPELFEDATEEEMIAVIDTFTVFEHYFQAYTKFTETMPMTKNEFKKFIGSIDNIPKFVKETFEWNMFHTLYYAMADFLQPRICGNKECGGFSFKKCARCNALHYCSKECQIKDFPYHKPACESWGKMWKTKQIIPNTLSMICNQLTDADKEVVTMEVFVEELLRKIYSCFHEELKKGMKSKHTEIIFFIMQRDTSPGMDQFKASMNPEKMDGLLGRGFRSENFHQFCKQIEDHMSEDDEGRRMPLEEHLDTWSLITKFQAMTQHFEIGPQGWIPRKV